MREQLVKRFTMNCAILTFMLIGGVLNALSFCIPHVALLVINVMLLVSIVVGLIASAIYYGYLNTIAMVDSTVNKDKAEVKDFVRSNIVTFLLCSIAAILFTLSSI